MADNNPRTTRVESNVTADAVRSVVTGPPYLGSAPVNDANHWEDRPQGADTGIRSVPGDSGYLYADTPSATVFIGKKQWLSEEWLYAVDSQSAEKSGRLYETVQRDVYERVITRKLQWLSDHEAFSKLRNKINNASQFGRISQEQKEQLLQKVSQKDPNGLAAADLDLLEDLNAVPTGLGNSNTTRYYTTPPRTTNPDSAIGKYNTKLQQLREIQQFAGPSSFNDLADSIDNQNNYIRGIDRSIKDIDDQLAELEPMLASLGDLIKKDQVTAVDPETNLDFVVRDEYNSLQKQYDSKLARKAELQKVLAEANRVLAEYEARMSEYQRVLGADDPETLEKEVADLKAKAQKELEDSGRLVPLNAFNGIIEFNNITGITTSLSLEGSGSASITMENPNNILRISRDDLLLAISDDPYLTRKLGNNESDAQKTVKVGADIPGYGGGQLKYYKGRYYDPMSLAIALENGGGALDAETGFSGSDVSNNLVQYRKQQQIIFQDIKTRIAAFPVYNWQVSDPNGITVAFLKTNQKQLTALYNYSDFDFDGTKGKQAVETLIRTLSKYEEKIPGDFVQDYSDKNDPKATPKANETQVQKEMSLLKAVRKIKGFEKAQWTTVNDLFRSIEQNFTGKYVVEVADRIWIWLSSPSKTVRLDEQGYGMAESAIGRVAAEIQGRVLIKKLQDQLNQAATEQARLEAIQDPIATELGTLEGELQDKELTTGEDQAKAERVQILEKQFNELEANIAALKQKQIAYQNEIEKIENEQDNPSATAKAPDYSMKVAGSSAGVLPPSAVIRSVYGGFEENQFQVFEGVITEVTGTFDGEIFILSAKAQDLTYYLEISRVMEKPSLASADDMALLNDPIYRAKTGVSADRNCVAKFDGPPEESAKLTDVNRHPLAGRWKSGQFVTTSIIYTDSDSERQLGQTEVESGFSPEDLICLHGLNTMSKLYGQLDSANIISLLVTGIPYNFSTYAFNTLRAEINARVENLDGSFEPNPNNPFEILRKVVGQQNRFLGNFQPFLEFNTTFDDRELPRLEQETQQRLDILKKLLTSRSERSQGKVANDQTFAAKILEIAQTKDGAKRMRDRVAAQGYGNAKGQRLRFFTETEARTWKEYFETTYNISSSSSPRVVELNNQKLSIGYEIDTLRRAIIDDTQKLNAATKSVGDASAAEGAAQGSANSDNAAAITTAEQQEQDRLRRILQKDQEDLVIKKVELAKVEEELAALPKSINGNSIDVISCITLDQQEVQAYLDVASIVVRYEQMKTLKQQFYESTQASFGLEPNDKDKPEALAVSLRKKYNQSAITATKRKIIEKKKVNYLLISEQYTADLNMQQYLQDVSDANVSEVFTSQYSSILAQCKEAAGLVDFEFYCDENGHLRFKPPTYNRLLKAHFNLDTLTPGVRLSLKNQYPNLEALQIVATIRLIAKTINDNVAEGNDLYHQAFDAYDRSRQQYKALGPVAPQSPSAERQKELDSAKKELIKKVEEKKQQSDKDKQALKSKIEALTVSSPADKFDDAQAALDVYLKTFNEQLATVNTEIAVAIEAITEGVADNKARADLVQRNGEYINLAASRVKLIDAHRDFLFDVGQIIENAPVDPSSIGINPNDPKLSLQQKEIIDQANTKGRISLMQALALKALSTIGEEPYFIDEEHIHIVGPQIILSETTSERRPDYVRLDVQGGMNYVPELASSVNGRFIWGGGVDYDLWRTYGYSQQSVERFFLQNRDIARDYCGALLARQRAKTLSCSVTVRGDSKYRVGDCVFMEDQFMYYYITGVSQNFSYGEYTTSLTLEYARRPGEFLAHPFDVVGRYLRNEYANAIKSNLQVTPFANENVEGATDMPSKEDLQYAQDVLNIKLSKNLEQTGTTG